MTLTLSGHDSNSIFSAIFSNTAKKSDNIRGIFSAIFSDTAILSGISSDTTIFSSILSNTAKNSSNFSSIFSGIFSDTAIFSSVLSDTAIFSNTAENRDIVKKERKKVMLAYFLLYSCFNIRHF